MKVIIAILALVSCVSTKELIPNSDQVKNLINECSEQHPLNSDQIFALWGYDFPTEEPVRQYMLCFAKGVAFYISKYEQINPVKEDEEIEAKKLAENCMTTHFRDDKDAAVIMKNVDDCVKKVLIGENYSEILSDHDTFYFVPPLW